jgi:hypothetical protein
MRQQQLQQQQQSHRYPFSTLLQLALHRTKGPAKSKIYELPFKELVIN